MSEPVEPRDAEQVERAKRQRWVRMALLLVAVACVFGLAQWARSYFGLEMSAKSIQQAVRELGVWAPLGYIALVAGRQVFALPSLLCLTSAGLLFGSIGGSLIGGVAMTLNALLLFFVGRYMGSEWVFSRIHERYPGFEEQARSVGPWVVALVSAHPLGPLTAVHFAAGATGLRAPVFAAAVLPALIFRAGCYAFLGANILEPGSPRFWIASAVLLAVSALPLAHPKWRARILGRRS